MRRIKNIFPIIDTFRTYSRSKFGVDLVAGLTVATILLPQGLAYAMLAGVSPIYGLYTGLIPLIVYSILGTSRHLSIGPVAISSLLILSGVSSLADPGSPEFLSLVIISGFFIGIGQLLLGVVKLGFIVNFISLPVMTGFTSAAAIIILSTQLRDALGIEIPRFESVFERLQYTVTHLYETHFLALEMCAAAIFLVWIFKKIHKAIPGALIVIVASILLVYFFQWDRMGLDILGDIPSGLPALQIPEFNFGKIRDLLPVILTVTTIGIVESISIAKVLESRHQDYTIDVDQELIAIGTAKVVGSFFQNIPSSGSFTRSAVNSNMNAKSTISSLVTAIVIGMVLIFLTPVFYYLPTAVLAAIILMAVVSLFDVKEAIHLWKTHRSDFTMMIVTFVLTLVLGIEEGVFIGVILSMITVLIKSSKPHIAVLGRIPESDDYRNINRFLEAKEPEKTIIIRLDDQLYFANAVYFREKVKKIISQPQYDDLEVVLLDASNMHEIDSTGIKVLKELIRDLNARGTELHLCSVKGPVRDRLDRNKMLVDADKHHMNIKQALLEIDGNKVSEQKKRRSLQSNIKTNDLH